MLADDLAPPIPPNPAPWLTDWLFDLGPAVPAGMGAGAVGWLEIGAWADLCGIDLMPWEARLLRRLSRDFVDQAHRAEKIDCPAPWSTPAMDAESRAAVSRKLAAAFAAFQQATNRS